MYIQQKQLSVLSSLLEPGKIILVYGPRRTGKTTLLKKYLESISEKFLFLNGDDVLARRPLESQSLQTLTDFIGDRTLLVIDEAHYIPGIGASLKLMADHCPNLKIIATGSSSFDLARNTGEPLTGRKYTVTLYPLAQIELSSIQTDTETREQLENRLIYGSYPEIILLQNSEKRRRYLGEIVSSYLFKDILSIEGLRHSDKIERLLQLLAHQIGKDVSVSELGTHLGMNKGTVDRYLDILGKTFVIFRRGGFSRNLRKELTRNFRYYFLDNGIRNTLVRNFNPLPMRNDAGLLWENYCVAERLKRQEYLQIPTGSYFWRTHTKQEIDLIEDRGGKLYAYEMKWQDFKEPAATLRLWQQTYPRAGFQIVNRENYLAFVR